MFEWDPKKERENLKKHGVDFTTAQMAFEDEHKYIETDVSHSSESEQRYFCYARIDSRILTVRFTIRPGALRIIGAGYWRKGVEIYENQKNQKK